MKFYTGQGDKGTSTLLGLAKRIPKNDRRFRALGAVDELNSYLGICRALSKDKAVSKALLETQENLFIIQAKLGSLRNVPNQALNITDDKIKELEKTIDKFSEMVGIITKFSIPGGSPLSAHLDYARAVCRRTERVVADLDVRRLNRRRTSQNWPALAYLNRLSSLLFVLARYANKKAGASEKNPSYK